MTTPVCSRALLLAVLGQAVGTFGLPVPANLQAGDAPARDGFVNVLTPNVVLSALKQAEDGNGLIMRVYEAAGASTRATLRCGFRLAGAEETDLIEENPARVTIVGSGLWLDLAPFEIRTFRLVPAGP